MTMDKFQSWREERVTKRDDQTIAKYLADNKIEAKQDTSGIYYVLYSSSTGPKPTAENCVEVQYQGKLLKDGREFDKNDRIAFSLQQVIPGWRLGIPMLSKGDSATFFIPSRLAYGPGGYPGAIPPDAVLIFNVKLFDFKNTFDPQTRSCK
jgi:FKBP-type peptidyl-prolyl cis-trans isomerase